MTTVTDKFASVTLDYWQAKQDIKAWLTETRDNIALAVNVYMDASQHQAEMLSALSEIERMADDRYVKAEQDYRSRVRSIYGKAHEA